MLLVDSGGTYMGVTTDVTRNLVVGEISDEIKSGVAFSEHNLLKDRYDTNYDMIVCRNVLIYFTDEAKDQVFRNFFTSLKSGGFLFIGSTEQIVNYREIGYTRENSFYYGKP